MRTMILVLATLLTAGLARAHFVFVVPAADGKAVKVVFSDSLDADEKVDIGKIAGLKLTGRFADGKSAPIECKKAEHCLTGEIGEGEPRCAYGSVDYGVIQKGSDKPYLLKYHPKAVLAGCSEKLATIGESAVLEIVPVAGPKAVFRVLVAGVGVAEAEVTVTAPDGTKTKVKTDKDGRTPATEGTGRFAASVKMDEVKVGEWGEKKYNFIRHYATLVVDIAGK